MATVPVDTDRLLERVTSGGNGGAGNGDRPPIVTHIPASKIYRTTRPRHVLVVEDNLDGVHTLVLLLRDMGHIVDYAINGYAALDLAMRLKPEFVFLDIQLPGLNGFEVCKRIKANASTRDTRIIAVTAYGQAEYTKQAEALGFERVLIKPVPPDTFEELLG